MAALYELYKSALSVDCPYAKNWYKRNPEQHLNPLPYLRDQPTWTKMAQCSGLYKGRQVVGGQGAYLTYLEMSGGMGHCWWDGLCECQKLAWGVVGTTLAKKATPPRDGWFETDVNNQFYAN